MNITKNFNYSKLLIMKVIDRAPYFTHTHIYIRVKWILLRETFTTQTPIYYFNIHMCSNIFILFVIYL